MSEFDDLEKELKALQPKSPTAAFTARVEDALGDSGELSFRRIDSSSHPKSRNRLLLFFPPLLALAASLVWVLFFWGHQSTSPTQTKSLPIAESNPSLPPESVVDPESPIHGVTIEELEAYSGMPTGGWSDPQVREFLLNRVDEGLIQRPGYSPGRQVRYHYIDETLWMHPSSNTRVISTTPRQEVIILDLDLY